MRFYRWVKKWAERVAALRIPLYAGNSAFFLLLSLFPLMSILLAMQRGYSALTLTLYSFFFCTLGSVIMVDWNHICGIVQRDSQIIWWILGTGFITAFFPYTLYSLGLSKMDAGKASILVSIELVAEAVFGSIVFHESLTTASVVGIALVLSAIIVLNLRRSKLK